MTDRLSRSIIASLNIRNAARARRAKAGKWLYRLALMSVAATFLILHLAGK